MIRLAEKFAQTFAVDPYFGYISRSQKEILSMARQKEIFTEVDPDVYGVLEGRADTISLTHDPVGLFLPYYKHDYEAEIEFFRYEKTEDVPVGKMRERFISAVLKTLQAEGYRAATFREGLAVAVKHPEIFKFASTAYMGTLVQPDGCQIPSNCLGLIRDDEAPEGKKHLKRRCGLITCDPFRNDILLAAVKLFEHKL